jgi:GNAT superfamily N-acetyltransferase
MTVRLLKTRKELDQFIRFPLHLYRDDPCFVPPLLLERRQYFNPARNPLFDFTEVTYFLAENSGGSVVGCVTAHVNRRHNEYWKEETGFFGFFETIEDFEVARGLMSGAEEWLKEKGMHTIRGPFNFSTNDECGFLVEGFDSSPTIMMTYTKPYYPDFMRRLGYEPAKDLLAYEGYPESANMKLVERLAARVRDKAAVKLRTLQMRNFEKEVARAYGVYNSAWERNWGFIPMTEAEFRFLALNLKHIIDPSFGFVAEVEDEVAGFALALPDYNQVLKKMRGRLFPFGFIHLLLGKKDIDTVRVIALGVIEKYRARGIDALLYHAIAQNFYRLGYKKCEMSWILEDNKMMRRALERIGAIVKKRYQIFEKKL